MNVPHVFDLDGTLLRGSSASMEIARALGRDSELAELERAFADATLATYAFAVAV